MLRKWRLWCWILMLGIWPINSNAASKNRLTLTCGEACAMVITEYYDIPLPKNSIYWQKVANHPTSSLYDLRMLLQDAGLNAEAFEGKYQELRDLKCPIVLHVLSSNGEGHFVVGFWNRRSDKLRIFDAAAGSETEWGPDDAKSIWSGVGLTVRKSPSNKSAQAIIPSIIFVLCAAFVGSIFIYRYRHRVTPALSVIVVCILWASFVSTTSADEPLPNVKPIQVNVNLGRIRPNNSRFDARLIWRNDSHMDLKVSKTISSCSCTVTDTPDNIISPGENLAITAHVDASAWKGNSGVIVLAYFQNETVPPVAFHLTFIKINPPEVSPTTLDFNSYLPGSNPSRILKITAVSDTREAGMSLRGTPTMIDNLATIEKVESWEEQFRLPASAHPSFRQSLTFRVIPKETPALGEWKDEISIPIRFENEDEVLRVPLRGEVQSRFFTRPSRIVALLRPNDSFHANIELWDHMSGETLPELRIIPSDNRLKTSTVQNEDQQTQQDRMLCTIVLDGELSTLHEKLDAYLSISITEHGHTNEIHIPVLIVPIKSGE